MQKTLFELKEKMEQLQMKKRERNVLMKELDYYVIQKRLHDYESDLLREEFERNSYKTGVFLQEDTFYSLLQREKAEIERLAKELRVVPETTQAFFDLIWKRFIREAKVKEPVFYYVGFWDGKIRNEIPVIVACMYEKQVGEFRIADYEDNPEKIVYINYLYEMQDKISNKDRILETVFKILRAREPLNPIKAFLKRGSYWQFDRYILKPDLTICISPLSFVYMCYEKEAKPDLELAREELEYTEIQLNDLLVKENITIDEILELPEEKRKKALELIARKKRLEGKVRTLEQILAV